jgi:HK97 gp10 family phage protein
MSEFVSHKNEVIKEKDEAIQRALEIIGLVAESYAKMNCPVDTGNLRNSISHTVKKDTAYIGTNVEYAPYVEFGTSKTKPQPYLKPAVMNHITEYKQLVSNELKKG